MAVLYVVATPIGNLEDISRRALQILKEVDYIACEDTRRTKILLDRHNIHTSTLSYHQHSTLQRIEQIIDDLADGLTIALVTDAGTPGISDPGGVLVEKVYQLNQTLKEPIEIISIPGPSSVTAALSVSGFPADTYLFLGFLPKKKGRQTLMKSIASMDKGLGCETIVFFESAVRIHDTLKDLVLAFSSVSSRMTMRDPEISSTYGGQAQARNDMSIEVCLCRELTKKFEEVWRGTLEEAVEKTTGSQKGEFVVVLHLNK